MEKTLNIWSKSDDWRAQILSNFAGTPFFLDGEYLISVEGFIQAIKFPLSDRRAHTTRLMMGKAAKERGREAAELYRCTHVWWKGKEINYGSSDHHELIARAIRAKIEQVPHVKEALLQTQGLVLTHDIGQDESPCTSLPASVFVKILTDLREELLLEARPEATLTVQ